MTPWSWPWPGPGPGPGPDSPNLSLSLSLTLRLSQVATGNLAKDMLKTEDAFIVDNETEIFVWVGKGATADERKAALSHGQDYVTKQGRPDWTRVTKILEGTEPTTFKSCFKKWQVAVTPNRYP